MERTANRVSGKSLLSLARQTFNEWLDDDVPLLGAALAYYTVFSLAPLIVIGIYVAGLVFDNAQDQVVEQLKGLFGSAGAEAVESMIEAARKPTQSFWATLLAGGTLFFGAAGVFIQLKDALNIIWDIPKPEKSGGIWAFLRKYFLSFGMVLGVGFMLMVSLLLEAGLAMLSKSVAGHLPGMAILMPALGSVLSFAMVTLLFAMLFKFLPDTHVAWREVWIGSLLTSALFLVGKLAIGFYLGKAGVASAYGAAGSLAVLLLWVYYSAQLIFFGAEFTQVYAKRSGKPAVEEVKAKLSPKKRQLVERIETARRKWGQAASAGKR